MAARVTVFAKDLARISAFYETAFGLGLVEDDPGVLRILGDQDWTLTVLAIPPHIAESIVIADPPIRREGTPIRLDFILASIEASRPVIRHLGGDVDPAGQTWEAGGFRRCNGSDPEGNVFGLIEPAAVIPLS